MITVSDLNKLISQWTERLGDTTQPSSYRDALFECCNELNNLVSKSIEEEIDAHEAFMNEMEQRYILDMEEHEGIA